MWDNPQSLISFIVGLILSALGIIPLLNAAGVIAFGLPEFLSGIVGAIVMYLLAGSGIYLLVEGFMEGFDHPMGKISVLVGFLVLVIGIIPLLNSFGIITFGIPFLSLTLFRILFVIEGLLLIFGAFNM